MKGSLSAEIKENRQIV
ncbi:Protein of unknown function [Bacillus mobilis]|nr:Protein of unknown function [Bacillus mobilis]